MFKIIKDDPELALTLCAIAFLLGAFLIALFVEVDRQFGPRPHHCSLCERYDERNEP